MIWGMRSRPAVAREDDIAAWAAHGRLGATMTTAAVAGSSLFTLMTSDGTLALGLVLLLAIAPVVTAVAFAIVPWARLVAGGRGPRLFTAWSVVTIT